MSHQGGGGSWRGAGGHGSHEAYNADVAAKHMHPQQPQASAEVAIPACPSEFPQIAGLPVEELQRLLGDGAALDALVAEHPHSDVIGKRLRAVETEVSLLEGRNKAREAELARLTGGGDGLSLDEQLAAEQAKLDAAQEKFDAWMDRNSGDQLERRLKVATREANEQASALTERFHAGDVPYDDYIREFTELRKTFHERSIKLQRFKNHRSAAEQRAAA